MNIRCQRNRKP